MRFNKILPLLAVVFVAAGVSFAQDKTLGAIKGKVRVETGTPSGVVISTDNVGSNGALNATMALLSVTCCT